MAKVLLTTEVTPSAAQAEPATLFVALELSKARSGWPAFTRPTATT
jgi:hypothetical protein